MVNNFYIRSVIVVLLASICCSYFGQVLLFIISKTKDYWSYLIYFTPLILLFTKYSNKYAKTTSISMKYFIEEAIKDKEIQASNFSEELKILKNSLAENKINFSLLKGCKISILSKLTPVEYPFMDKTFNQKIAEIFEKISSIINNIVRENNPTVDENIRAAYLATDEKVAIKNWQKALWDGKEGGSVLGDAPYCTICYLEHLYFVRDGLDLGRQKLHTHARDLSLMANIEEWDFKK